MTMTRGTLSVVAIVGAIVCVAALSFASALARRDPDNTIATRTIPWHGTDALTIGVPAHVRFVQGPGPGTVIVTGPRRSVETFGVENGVLDDHTLRTGAELEIVVTAPKVTRFSANGRDRLTIERFDQDLLRIETAGWAEVSASGRAGTVQLSLDGFGWVNLGELESDGASIAIAGSRSAIVSPTAWATVSGSGSVIFLTQPPKISLDPQGGGRVIQARAPAPR